VKRFRTPALTLGQQMLAMQQFFPSFHYSRKNNIPTWKGTLQPTDASPVYTVKISYRFDNQFSKSPRVWVVSPKIRSDAKHRYRDQSLCLYYPKDQSWTPYKFISETIVPWTSLWLLFYEIWLDTDHWYGPEVAHTGPK
jgi:hypothetical protein